jgi:hypothetical protein
MTIRQVLLPLLLLATLAPLAGCPKARTREDLADPNYLDDKGPKTPEPGPGGPGGPDDPIPR